MKRKFLSLTLIFLLTCSSIIGCGKEKIKETINDNAIVEETNEETNEVAQEEVVEEIDWAKEYENYFVDHSIPSNNVKLNIIMANPSMTDEFSMSMSIVDNNFAMCMNGNGNESSIYVIDNKMYIGSVVDGVENWVYTTMEENEEESLSADSISMVDTSVVDTTKISSLTYVEEQDINGIVYDILEVTIPGEDDGLYYVKSSNGTIVGLAEGATAEIDGEVLSWDDEEKRVSNDLVCKFRIDRETREIYSVEYLDITSNSNIVMGIETISEIVLPEAAVNAIEVSEEDASMALFGVLFSMIPMDETGESITLDENETIVEEVIEEEVIEEETAIAVE